MIYRLEEEKLFDGKEAYLDISEKLHELLQAEEISFVIDFKTESTKYMALFAVYYKESLLPDFSINVNKGYLTVTTVKKQKMLILSGEEAYNDAALHRLYFRGNKEGIRIWVDGKLVIKENVYPYCDFRYVGFATIGRGTLEDNFQNYFEGIISRLDIMTEEAEDGKKCMFDNQRPEPQILFERGMERVINFRIPSLLTTDAGTVIAAADARIEAPGDNPNHIVRAFRISHDSGKTFGKLKLFCDYGGKGRDQGASAIDGSMVQDRDTGEILMIYSHTSAGIGSFKSQPGTGFDKEGRLILTGTDGKSYRKRSDGAIVSDRGGETGYMADAYGRLFKGGKEAGSINHGENRLFCQEDTSFIHLIFSKDEGETWSEPQDITLSVKEEWMKFMGAGPGVGIQLKEGKKAGRLIFPVYYSSSVGGQYSCGIIYSDDHGKNWSRGASVNDGRIFQGNPVNAREVQDGRAQVTECQVVELPDSRLKIFMRNYIGEPYVVTALSDNGGESFYGHEVETQLLDPDCQSSIIRAEAEDKTLYLFSNPAHESLRVHGVVRGSEDGTKNWNKEFLLEPGEFGYSCMSMMPDGNVGILYEGKDIAICFAKFPLSVLTEKIL